MTPQPKGAIPESNYNAVLPQMVLPLLPGWNITSQQTRQIKGSARIPDVMIYTARGMPIAVECKFDKTTNISNVEKQAVSLLETSARGNRQIDIAVAVLYPDSLAHAQSQPAEALSESVLRYAAYYTTSSGGTERFPAEGWLNGGLNKFAGFLDVLGDPSMVVNAMAARFTEAVVDAASIMDAQFPDMAEAVKQENCEQTDQMVAALMLNAFIFHHIVARHHPSKVLSPSQMHLRKMTTQTDVGDMWCQILDINYYPIFGVALECLMAIPDASKASEMLKVLMGAANDVASSDPYAAQNLAGEAFGALISDRKFLASFYTLPAAAHLLSELAVSRLVIDWSNSEEITRLRVADFACGTGALLTASYKRIQQRAHLHGVKIPMIHQQMLEKVFVGTDIMPAAVHITAASLSGFHPQQDYKKTETHVMPFGDCNKLLAARKEREDRYDSGFRVGSLELLNGDRTQTLFGDGTKAVAAQGEDPLSFLHVPHGSCDIVIMNPPYTSPTNHTIEERQDMSRPDFAAFGVTKDEQREMAKRAKHLTRKVDDSVRDGKAGMGTDFFDIAHAKLKPGGVAAFVLSASMPTGASWQPLRDLLSTWYRDVCIVSISSGKMAGRGFSADTHMAEILLVATKRAEARKENSPEEPWAWVVLNEQPQTKLEAMAIADTIKQAHANQGPLQIKAGDTSYGHISVCERHIPPVMLRSPDVVEALLALADPETSAIMLPRQNSSVRLHLCRLDELGTCGPVHRLIAGSGKQEVRDKQKTAGPFTLSDLKGSKTDFPILWNHHWQKETKFTVQPDKQGRRPEEKAGEASEIWATATRLHFNLDYDFTSQPLAACLTPEPAIGGRAWPSFTLHDKTSERRETMEWVYPVLLWCNSTLGLMAFYITGTRNQRGRSCLTVSRLPELPVLDPRQLSPSKLADAEAIYNRLKDKEFKQPNLADCDPTRKELDEALLGELLGHSQSVLDRLAIIREQWCNEPHLRSRRRESGAN